ncbi:MAG TPA: hypothetical protein ENI85_15285 [Deltaproteobacteria bacterium]|nr:hypothetical protein [Deltaproteobacteria bacterium]
MSRWVAIGVVFAFFLPLLFRGAVIAAHDNRLELGLPGTSEADPSNRKFSDQTAIFIPEIQQHLHGKRAGWLSLWNPYVEMGRPVHHVSGSSKAYHLFHLLSLMIDDPFVLYTILIVVAIVLSVLFGHLFFEALGFPPTVCFVASLGLGLGVFSAYWLTFALFLWTLAWSLGLLWCITRFLESPGPGWGSGVAFMVHSLLLSGYPQQIVLHAYFIVGFGAYQAWRSGRSMGDALRRILMLGLCGALGVLTVAPVYLDLALALSRSARLDPGSEFFLSVLPRLDGWRDLVVFLGQVFDAFWYGNPIDPGHPLRFDGISLTPVPAALALASLVSWRRLWPIQFLVLVSLLANTVPGVFRFGVEHAGLGLSRFNPLAGMQIPIFLLAAHGLDRAMRGESISRWGLVMPGIVAGGIAVLGLAVSGVPFDVANVAIGLSLLSATVWLLWAPRTWLAVGLALASVLFYSARLPLSRPLESIAMTSPLVERLRALTPEGSRFAWVGPGRRLIPSNEEALVGIPSIHAYDSLSSRAYQDWVLRVSRVGTRESGRYFLRVAGTRRLFGHEFPFTGIAAILSEGKIRDERVEQVDRRIHRVRQTPRLEAQVVRFQAAGNGATASFGTFEEARTLPIERLSDEGDRISFRLTPSKRETLVFLSQQYHPQWRATAGTTPLPTPIVNGFYQGILVPPDTGQIEVRFRPFARWSWIPQVFFMLLFAWLSGYRIWTRRKGGSPIDSHGRRKADVSRAWRGCGMDG